MGVGGVRTWRELQSEPCIDFEDVVRDRQQVCVSRSFAKEITNIDDLDSAISTFTTKVAAKLRSSGLCAGELKTFILTNRFKEDMPQSFSIKTTLFEVATNDTIEMIKASTEALKSIFKRGYGYKKAGVVACSIVPSNAVQNSLFAEENREQHRALMEVIDKINIKEGYNTIRVASQGEMDDFSSRSNISPRRTTQWSEILEIKC
jgi:DNA polymerase V